MMSWCVVLLKRHSSVRIQRRLHNDERPPQRPSPTYDGPQRVPTNNILRLPEPSASEHLYINTKIRLLFVFWYG